MKDKLLIYSDGGSRGNPGPAAFAFVVIKGGRIVYKNSKYIGKTTNNVAEYKGVREAIRWMDKNSEKIKSFDVVFFLDSQLVVRQLMGDYKIKNEKLIPLAREIMILQKRIPNKISFNFVKRDKNKIADKLLNEKLDKISKRN